MAEQETIADIIVKKRKYADEIERKAQEYIARSERVPGAYQSGIVYNIRSEADRLEAAHKREVQNALDVGGFVEASRKNKQVGNAAKLREALVRVRDFADRIVEDRGLALAIINTCDAALAAPPRNCDALSVQEQTEKFNQFCQSHRHSDLPKCAGCPLEDIPDGTGCAQAWGQMPYESEAAK